MAGAARRVGGAERPPAQRHGHPGMDGFRVRSRADGIVADGARCLRAGIRGAPQRPGARGACGNGGDVRGRSGVRRGIAGAPERGGGLGDGADDHAASGPRVRPARSRRRSGVAGDGAGRHSGRRREASGASRSRLGVDPGRGPGAGTAVAGDSRRRHRGGRTRQRMDCAV